MRIGVWLVILCGCGRVGFDDAPRADAALIACMTDGEPCDDGNICTTTSSCQAGVCVPPIEIATCKVADSETEFALVQGAQNWFYGYWNVSIDPNSSYDLDDYLPFVVLNNAWRPPTWEPQPSPNYTWAYLLHWGGHPGTFPEIYVPVRRWVSDVSGRASVVVTMSKAGPGGGDGTRGIVVVDGIQRFSRILLPDDVSGFVEPVAVDVVIGSKVDILMHPNDSDAEDATTMTIVIEARN